MPKVVMEELGLEISKPYKYLCSFDYVQVKSLGVIKGLVATLSQLSMKSIVMDVVVADIPPRFGIFLSWSWANKLGGTMKLDMSYVSIHVFVSEHRRLYKEVQLAFIVSDP